MRAVLKERDAFSSQRSKGPKLARWRGEGRQVGGGTLTNGTGVRSRATREVYAPIGRKTLEMFVH